MKCKIFALASQEFEKKTRQINCGRFELNKTPVKVHNNHFQHSHTHTHISTPNCQTWPTCFKTLYLQFVRYCRFNVNFFWSVCVCSQTCFLMFFLSLIIAAACVQWASFRKTHSTRMRAKGKEGDSVCVC